MDLGLKGKIALVSGASKGLGYAVARALAGEGAHVAISSRDERAIREAAQRIEQETGARVAATAVDVG
jgi:3-oxoacyl-[acyl-carrier protein] reductase